MTWYFSFAASHSTNPAHHQTTLTLHPPSHYSNPVQSTPTQANSILISPSATHPASATANTSLQGTYREHLHKHPSPHTLTDNSNNNNIIIIIVIILFFFLN